MNNENSIQGINSDVEVTQVTRTHKPRGFAAMNKDRVREIAARGGKAAHAAGTAHQFNSDEARVAGAIGGKAFHRSRGKKITIVPVPLEEKKVA